MDFVSNKTSLKGLRNIKYVFLRSTKLNLQLRLCGYSNVLSLLHCVIREDLSRRKYFFRHLPLSSALAKTLRVNKIAMNSFSNLNFAGDGILGPTV